MRSYNLIYILFLTFIVSCADNKQLPSQGEQVAFQLDNKKEFDEKNLQPAFLLSSGNEIIINVWRHDDLGKTLKIDSTGYIDLPLVGSIRATGLTVAQLREDIALRLLPYIKSPRVDINVSESNLTVHVLGEVTSPGVIEIDSTITVWEAISKLGGFTNDANKDYVLVARSDGENFNVSAIHMDMDTIVKEGGFSTKHYLQDGDILFVAETRISSIESFMTRMNNIIKPIVTLQQMFILIPEVLNVIESGFVSDSENTNIIVTPN